MPADDFNVQLRHYRRVNEGMIEEFANRYSVSRGSLRRLLDQGQVSQQLYEEKAAEWTAQAQQRDGEGGNYYATQAAYLGEHYLKLVLGKHYQGKLTVEQAAEYLGVKPKNVVGLEAFALQGA